MRPTAGKAALRPAQNSSARPREVEIRQVVAPQRSRDRLDPLDQVIDLDAGPVEFDDQQRLDVERIAGMDEVLGRMDRRPVHHLHAARDDAGADDPATHSPAASTCAKPTSSARAVSGFCRMPHRDLGDDAEQAFRAGDDAEQVIAAGIGRCLPPSRMTSPVISTISKPSTLLVVMPYFRQCTPPEFSATLPPIEQAICEDGSGA